MRSNCGLALSMDDTGDSKGAIWNEGVAVHVIRHLKAMGSSVVLNRGAAIRGIPTTGGRVRIGGRSDKVKELWPKIEF